MTPIYIIIEPFNPVTGLRETVRLGSAASSAAMGIEGLSWAPAISQRPVFSIELMSPDLDGRVQAGQCSFAINLNAFANGAIMAGWKWLGAPITLYSAPDLALPAEPDFAGRVSAPSLDRQGLILAVQASVDTTFLDKPLLTDEFDGSGNLGGEPDKRGTLKPAGFGACENIPPVWFDTTNWIGMIDGYGNTTAITRLMEGLNDFGARVADYANYAALKAAIEADAVPPGRWGSCVAQGLVGLGAPPTGPITVNATFGSNRLGAIAQRILTTHALVPGGNVDVAAFAALDAAVNRPAHYWTAEQREVRDLLEAMAASANATPLVTGQNEVTITRAVASAAVATLDRSGRILPRVTDWRSTAALPPVWRLTGRVARPASVVDLKDVNYVDDIIDRGAWAVGTVYRAGNFAWLANKSSWLYIGATPTAGNAPPAWPTTSNSYWQNLTPPALASALTYADGSTIESLKPAAAGADPTAANVAAGIAGQAPTATSSDFSVVTGATKPANNATLGGTVGTNVYKTPGVVYSQAQLETILGTAAAFAGQSAWATLVAPVARVSKIDDSGNIQATGIYKPGVSFLDVVWPAELGANVTANWTAAGFVGQGSMATKDTADAFADLSGAGAAGMGSVTWVGTGANPTNAKAVGNVTARVSGSFAWAASLISREAFKGGVRLTATPLDSSPYMMAGLCEAGSITAGVSNEYGQLAHAAFFNGTHIQIYENNSSPTGTDWLLGDSVVISYANGKVRYERVRAGVVTLIREVTVASGKTFWAAAVHATPASQRVSVVAATFADGSKLDAVENLADVTKTVSYPPEIVINYDHTGALTSALPVTASGFKLTPAGGASFATGVTWAVSVLSGSFASTAPSMSGTGTGQLAINSNMTSPEAILSVTAAYGGKTYPPVLVKVKKNQSAPPAGGGTASDATLSSFSSTSFVAISDELTAATGTSATLTAASVQLTIDGTAPAGATNVEVKWQWWNGSAWADVGSAVASSPSPNSFDEGGFYQPYAGAITCNQTKSSLTAGTHKFRLMARISGGNTRFVYPNGTAGVQG